MLTIKKVNSMKGGKVWLTFFCCAAISLLFLYIHRLCADTICIRRHFMLCLVLP